MNVEDAIAVLNGPICGRIRFTFNSAFGDPISVDASSFRRVATALRLLPGTPGHISFSTANFPGQPVADAAYNWRSNVMWIPQSSIAQGRAFVETAFVHESVHASFDLTRSVLPVVDNELAAFLAETLYVYFANYPFHTRLCGAVPIFSRFVAGVAATGRLDDFGAATLRRQIETHRHYMKEVLNARGGYIMDQLDG